MILRPSHRWFFIWAIHPKDRLANRDEYVQVCRDPKTGRVISPRWDALPATIKVLHIFRWILGRMWWILWYQTRLPTFKKFTKFTIPAVGMLYPYISIEDIVSAEPVVPVPDNEERSSKKVVKI